MTIVQAPLLLVSDVIERGVSKREWRGFFFAFYFLRAHVLSDPPCRLQTIAR